MSNAAQKYTLFVNEFFMKRANSFMKTMMKNSLKIKHYWGRVQFAPGRGAIHVYIVAIAKNKACLQEFFDASTPQKKAQVLNNYTTDHLNMTAVIKVNDSKNHPQNYLTLPLTRQFCECFDDEEDVRQLAEDYIHHDCNRHCLRSSETGKPRTCRSHFGTENEFGKLDTQGMELIERAQICIDRKGISHFRMRRTQLVHLVQHSQSLLKGWRENCDIKLLLYYSNPSRPDISEIEDVCRYVMANTGKRHNTSQEEKEAIQNIVTG
jgi:hypothetical protein